MIYAIICEKGGVGKTATAEAMCDGLRQRGKNVLVIDLDGQRNITAGMSADNTKPTIYQVLTGNVTTAEAIQHTRRGDLIAGDRRISDIRSAPAGTLRDALEDVRSQYDAIIIDCAPGRGPLTANAIVAADELIIPVTADAYCLQALGGIRATIQEAQKAGRAVKIRGLLITRYLGRTIVHREISTMINDVAAKLDTVVFKTKIRECSAIRTAQANKQGIFEAAPRSNAAKDYGAFLDELEGK